MIKVLKAICLSVMVLCLLFIAISVLLFSGETIDFSSAVLLFLFFLLVGLLFTAGYYKCKSIEESNDWMELGKKDKPITNYPPNKESPIVCKR
jgi:UPF0716 family protein affecting phage T7 exclusion